MYLHIVLQNHFLHKYGYETLPHSPYSPDLSSSDFPFLKYEKHLSRRTFFNDEEVVTAGEELVFFKFINFYKYEIK